MSMKDLILAGAFGGKNSSGGVSSWNDLTDKPFYEDENAVLLPVTEFVYNDSMQMFLIPGEIEFVVGKAYTVNWNGADYETECFLGEYNEEIFAMLGNPTAVGGENNNLPFVIACTQGMICAIPLDGSTAVSVGITGDVVVQIEEKFLPDASIPFWVDITEDNGTYSGTCDPKELMNAHKAGRIIMARVTDADSGIDFGPTGAVNDVMHLNSIAGNIYYGAVRFSRISDNQVDGSSLQIEHLWGYWENGNEWEWGYKKLSVNTTEET